MRKPSRESSTAAADTRNEKSGKAASVSEATTATPDDSTRTANDLLQAVLNAASNTHLAYLDRDFNFIMVNRTYAERCGSEPGAMIGRNHFDLFPDGENQAIFTRVRDTGVPAEFHDRPFVFPGPPERLTYWDWTLAPVRDHAGGIGGLVLSLFETTKRREAEEELLASEKRYRNIFEGANDGIISCDLTTGKFLYINNRMSALTGYSPEEMSKLSVRDLHPPEDLPHVLEEFSRLASGKISETGRIRVLRKDGNVIYCDISSSFLDRTTLIGFFRDITSRKEAEDQIMVLNEQLRRRVAELDDANKELDAFAHSVSHDLRAPLRTIAGFIRILASDHAGQLNEQGRDYMARVLAGTEKMNRLIEQLLYLSRISRQELRRASFDIGRRALAIVEALRAADPDRRVEANIQEGLTVMADPGLTDIILSNLLGNAWKFTLKTVKACIEFGAEEGDGTVVYYVRDNGAGFAAQYRDSLFIPFRRLHTEREFEGTGIGLSIVERIVRRHDGRIWAESEPGKGATFYFTLG